MSARLIIARYSGVCIQCEERIHKGDAIQFHGKGRGISCEECSLDNDRDERNEDEAPDSNLAPSPAIEDLRVAA